MSRKAAAKLREAEKKNGAPVDSASTTAKKKTREREAVAKEQKLPVRKVRAAQELEKTPEGKKLAAEVLDGEKTLAQAKRELDKDKPSSKERGHFPQQPIHTITAQPEDEKAYLALLYALRTVARPLWWGTWKK